MLNQTKEQEFFKLAATVLDCLYHLKNLECDKVFVFIGQLDYSSEMYLLIKEVKSIAHSQNIKVSEVWKSY